MVKFLNLALIFRPLRIIILKDSAHGNNEQSVVGRLISVKANTVSRNMFDRYFFKEREAILAWNQQEILT